MPNIACLVCGKVFCTQSNVNRHVREVHHQKPKPISYAKDMHRFKCMEMVDNDYCDKSFNKKENLITHLNEEHSKNFEILETVGTNIDEKPKRIDLLTHEDVRNIKNSYNIENANGKRHHNDATSVHLWVQECNNKTTGENPIIFYKPQESEEDGFKKEDFCLLIMNSFQKSMLLKFGKNIIAIDGTHGLNGYDLDLVTLLVIDEFNQGFPVAFLFSNRKDTFIYTFFFDCIRDNVGIIQCKTFMSDMEGAFYIGWEKIMGPAQHTLFCSWHVDRAWQCNLSKIANKEKRANVYQALKILQQKTDEGNFQKCLINFVHFLNGDSDTAEFGKYFRENYCSNFTKLAYCFRNNCGINTNMHLESMHKIIKYFYLEGRVVKRLDKGLNAVMKYLRNRSVSRYIDLNKGKNTKQSRLNFVRHNKALNSTYSLVINGDVYTLEKPPQDSSTIQEPYCVTKLNTPRCCENSCSCCGICRHMFSCSCPDFTNNNVICKHIHYVVLHIKNLNIVSSHTPLVEMNECVKILSQDTSEDRTNSSKVSDVYIQHLLN
ncbi:hypothetical protein NQ315_016270 [Exocentrus adspersus]|uniref:C2H2-type domain-containing protein n=1 Tax=Exocentrus adspersus TaxID=1586481 RepID=A0AAV8VCV1_9CUCU|nr:hypothetical protein NQ315_016270 [Exocentrus adspersus]